MNFVNFFFTFMKILFLIKTINWGYNGAIVSLIKRKILVCNIESCDKKIY